MKWYEFTEDNGDGSYSKLRFRTRDEAEEALEWLQDNCSYWCGDGNGVTVQDTESSWFFRTLDEVKSDNSWEE